MIHHVFLLYIHTITGWWFGTLVFFPSIGNFIIPTDFHIFQDGLKHQPVIVRPRVRYPLRWPQR